MNLETLKLEIEADARVFAESIAKKSVIAFTEGLSKSAVAGLTVAEPQKPKVKRGRPAKNNGAACKVADCGKKVIAKGLCSSHYQKARAKARAKAAAAQPEQNGAATTTSA